MMTEMGSSESSHLLQQIMQSLMEGIAITDLRGQLVYANRSLEQLLGYEPGELIGQPWTRLFPEKLQGHAQDWQATAPDPVPSRYEARLLHKNGTVVPVSAVSSPLTNGNHNHGTLFTFSDLREHRQSPGQVEPVSRPALMGQEVASLIHELSNSLTILFLQTQLLSKKAPPAPPYEENLAVIRDQARRMILTAKRVLNTNLDFCTKSADGKKRWIYNFHPTFLFCGYVLVNLLVLAIFITDMLIDAGFKCSNNLLYFQGSAAPITGRVISCEAGFPDVMILKIPARVIVLFFTYIFVLLFIRKLVDKGQ